MNDLIKVIDSHIGECADVTEYIDKIVVAKEDLKLTWTQISEIVYDKWGFDRARDYYRRRAIAIQTGETTGKADEFSEKFRSLRKERIKLSDQITQNNAILRRLSREETIKEIAKELADKMNSDKMLEVINTDELADFRGSGSKAEGILCLSDWHYGIEVSSYFNTYNVDVAKKRISNLLQSVIKACTENSLQKLHVLNLGDLICGRIHLTLRLQSRIDVMTQIMDVSEILAEFLNELSKYVEVEYYDCLDNHSRLEPNKKESLDLESLTRIIPWYLSDRLASNDKININKNLYGKDIISFDCLGHSIVGVHGHDDKASNALDHITLMTHKHYDLLCIAHFHHFSGDEKNESVIVGNGTLMGTDEYAEKLRLSSKPSQNLIIVTESNVIEDIKRILV